MSYTKEIVHEPKGIDKRHFSSRIIEAKPFADAGFKQGGYGLLEDDFYVQRIAKRGFHIFVFTLSGHGLVTFEDGTEVIINPGEAFISWSNGQGHYERPMTGEVWEMVWFSLWDSNSRFYPSSDDYEIIQFSQGDVLKSIALKLFEEELIDDTISTQSIELYEELFLLNVKRALGWRDRGPVSRNQEILSELWKKVTFNLDRAWTVAELADEAGISRTHLNRLCLDIYKQSPGERVRDMKMRQAKILLKNSDESIGEISDELGFSSISIFSHAFKEYYGISPRDFRKGTAS